MMKNDENQFPDAVFRKLDGGFTATLPYGGSFIPQNDGAYMCVAVARDGNQPIFRIQGIDLKGDGVLLTHESVKSPVGVTEYLKAHENLTRELENLGKDPAPIQKRGEWYYYVHEDPKTGVNDLTAVSLGHMGVLSVRCMKNDIFFTLDNTAAEA